MTIEWDKNVNIYSKLLKYIRKVKRMNIVLTIIIIIKINGLVNTDSIKIV